MEKMRNIGKRNMFLLTGLILRSHFAPSLPLIGSILKNFKKIFLILSGPQLFLLDSHTIRHLIVIGYLMSECYRILKSFNQFYLTRLKPIVFSLIKYFFFELHNFMHEWFLIPHS